MERGTQMALRCTEYAKIGVGILVQATGLQENHKNKTVYFEKVLDKELTGCHACPYSVILQLGDKNSPEYMEAEPKCTSCPFKQYKTVMHTKEEYINEKARYGNAPRLATLPLKMLILLHFLYPDSNGFIKDIRIDQLAEKLNCHRTSIINVLNRLSEYGYISYCCPFENKLNIYLKQYKQYFFKANEGGRGYITLSRETLDELLKSKLNCLRISLRLLIHASRSKDDVFEKSMSYKEIKRFLPFYCKPNTIRKALKNCSIFVIGILEKSKSISFTLKQQHNANQQKEKQLEFYSDEIRQFIDEADKYIISKRENTYTSPTDDTIFHALGNPEDFHSLICSKFSPVNPNTIEELANLCCTHTLNAVKNALMYVYKHYISKNNAIRHPVRLVGDCIRKGYLEPAL